MVEECHGERSADRGPRVIVHVTDCFHPRLGGIEIQVDALARAQKECGETVHVITATPADKTSDRSDYGYPVHRVVASLPWELPVHPRAGTNLLRLFHELRPDTVHAHLGSVAPFAWSAVSSALRSGIPTVVTVHSLWGRASRAMYRLLDHVAGWGNAPLVMTAVSSVAVDLIKLTGANGSVTTVPNGIDTRAWRGAANLERVDDAVHVVAVGRLAAHKQPVALLKALDTARSRIDPRLSLRATIAGTGPALPMMQRYLRRHGMTEWVRLPGRLDRDDVRSLLATADLFVNPAVHEAFGIATLEARTVGVPVIARAGNGVADFIRNGREGVLCDSMPEFVEALAWLAQDNDARRRMHAHNLATEPVHCSWPVVTAAFRQCYDRAATLTATPIDEKPPRLADDLVADDIEAFQDGTSP